MEHVIEPLGQAPWVVVKFGGTSVSRVSRWRRIEEIVRGHVAARRRVLVVCSAVASVTDLLTSCVDGIDHGEVSGDKLDALRRVHAALAEELGVDLEGVVGSDLDALRLLASRLRAPVGGRDRARVLRYGERLSTRLGAAFLARRGLDVGYIDARELLVATEGSRGADHYLAASCTAKPCSIAQARLQAMNAPVILTEGFVARNRDGETVLLGRGGSDTSAAYLAAVVGAREVEIWTDVPGMFTADPRSVKDTRILERVSYSEAEALGSLGAKVLHPRTIAALRKHRIGLRVGSTEHPQGHGTRVSGKAARHGVKAIASRSELVLLILSRPSSWQPVGFMSAVAERFRRRGWSMDLTATSCSEIRVTLDLAAFPSARNELPALLHDLAEVCQPSVVQPVGCVSLIGTELGPMELASSELCDVIRTCRVYLTSHAANRTHVSYVVETGDVPKLLHAAHRALQMEAAPEKERAAALAPREVVREGSRVALERCEKCREEAA